MAVAACRAHPGGRPDDRRAGVRVVDPPRPSLQPDQEQRYPRDFTFVCPTELRGFAELQDDFAAQEAELVAASTDSWHVHKAWFEHAAQLAPIRYPVAADTAHRLSRAYGVLADDGSALRGTFAIDPRGTVRHASVTDPSAGRSPEETLRIVQALRTGQLCPVSWRPGQPTLEIAA